MNIGVIVKKILPSVILAAVVLVFSLFVPSASTPQTLSVNADTMTRKVEFTQLWSFRTERSYVASPVFVDGLIYVITANSGSGIGILYCINASSGN